MANPMIREQHLSSGASDQSVLQAGDRRDGSAPVEDALDRKPLPHDVHAAYLWILGRAPESEDVVQTASRIESVRDLRRKLLDSDELRARVGELEVRPLPAKPLDIELSASTADIAEMLRRQRHAWQRIAQTALHWSCLPDHRFLAKAFADNQAAFAASGRMDRERVENVLSRLGISTDRLHHLVDFGCGIGRGTLHLAALFPEVSGVDISAPHLEQARSGAKARAMDHIRWLRSTPDRPMPATAYDVWFSRATLQYCAPPVAREILFQAFCGLRPGGVAIFQLIVYGAGYRFRVSDYLASNKSDPWQLHVLPQAEVFALASAAGLCILEMHENVVAGVDRRHWASVLIAARRPD